MRKKSTKLLALLTAGITAASLLAGCGSGGSDKTQSTDQTQESSTQDAATDDTAATEDTASDATEDAAADTAADAGSYPIAEGGTLTYWLRTETFLISLSADG